MKVFLGLMSLCFLTVGCDYTSNPIANNNAEGSKPLSNTKAGVFYESDIKPMLTDSCMPCHGAGNPKNWQDFEATKQYSQTILASIEHASGFMAMPMGRPKLSDENIELFRSWIDNGMEEKAPAPAVVVEQNLPPQSPTVNNPPTSEEIEALVYYDRDIQPMMLQNCVPCHNHGGRPKYWQSYEQAKNYSQVILASIQHAPGAVPMPAGREKLSEELIEMFRTWVNTGMKEHAPSTTTESSPTSANPKQEQASFTGESFSSTPSIVGDETNPIETSVSGSDLYNNNCALCHNYPEFYPRLGAQEKNYLIDQMQAFRDKNRMDPTMQFFAGKFLQNDADIRSIAEYLSNLNSCDVPHIETILDIEDTDDEPNLKNGEALYTSNCITCHSTRESPVLNIPVILGLNANYLLKTLTELKSGDRPSTVMNGILMNISRQQLVDVSAYINTQTECE